MFAGVEKKNTKLLPWKVSFKLLTFSNTFFIFEIIPPTYLSINHVHFPSSAEDDITTAVYLQFDVKEIEAATSNFLASNKIGQGGFGVVYKAFFFILYSLLFQYKHYELICWDNLFRLLRN